MALHIECIASSEVPVEVEQRGRQVGIGLWDRGWVSDLAEVVEPAIEIERGLDDQHIEALPFHPDIALGQGMFPLYNRVVSGLELAGVAFGIPGREQHEGRCFSSSGRGSNLYFCSHG